MTSPPPPPTTSLPPNPNPTTTNPATEESSMNMSMSMDTTFSPDAPPHHRNHPHQRSNLTPTTPNPKRRTPRPLTLHPTPPPRRTVTSEALLDSSHPSAPSAGADSVDSAGESMSSDDEGSPSPPRLVSRTENGWDVEDARADLRSAVETLARRGLRVASRWAAEQLVGLAPPSVPNPTHTKRRRRRRRHRKKRSSPQTDPQILDLEQYAASILDLGEYHRAASILSQSDHVPPTRLPGGGGGDGGGPGTTAAAVMAARGDSLPIRPPLEGLSGEGVWVRSYGLFMAGERRKEEEILELRDPLERTSLRNANLAQLTAELDEYHRAKALDSFGLYIYGVVLKEIQKTPSSSSSSHYDRSSGSDPNKVLSSRNILLQESAKRSMGSDPSILNAATNPTNAITAHSILIESLTHYPCNWSAWLDLAELCSDPSIYPQVEELLRPISSHWMYHFFCVHLFLENQANENAIMVMDRLIQGIPPSPSDDDDHDGGEGGGAGGFFVQSPYLQSQLAVAHYNMSDFETAQSHFSTLALSDPHRLDQMDVYSNILYVKEDKVALSQLAHLAVKIDKYRPETCCIVGNYYSLKSQHEKAVQYFQRALKLDRTYMSAWTLMGHEYLEMKNTAAAIEAYRRAVDINPRDYRAWYGLGQTYEIMNMLLYALFYYRKAVELRPYDARMWCAMGGCYLGLERRADAVRSFERAVANHDEEGIATKRLATLYREDGNVERAARCYLRHLELRFQAQVNRPTPDLGGDAMEAIITSVNVDEPEADALLFLAFYYHEHGELEMASMCCSRLLDFPGPEKEQGKALLREIRARLDLRGNMKGGEDQRLGGDSPSFRGSLNSKTDESFEFSP